MVRQQRIKVSHFCEYHLAKFKSMSCGAPTAIVSNAFLFFECVQIVWSLFTFQATVRPHNHVMRKGIVWGALNVCFPIFSVTTHGAIRLTQFNCDNNMLIRNSMILTAPISKLFLNFVFRSSALCNWILQEIYQKMKFYSVSNSDAFVVPNPLK